MIRSRCRRRRQSSDAVRDRRRRADRLDGVPLPDDGRRPPGSRRRRQGGAADVRRPASDGTAGAVRVQRRDVVDVGDTVDRVARGTRSEGGGGGGRRVGREGDLYE